MTATATERKITGTLSGMDSTGDTKVAWDKDNPDEVAAAKAMFERLKGKGYLAYSKKGDSREQIRAFNPGLEQIVMKPQLVGG